jgi:acyl transferase domain-containing protein
MNQTNPRELTDLQRAGLAIKTLQGRLQELETRSREPIAVVGMGCRFPGGADDPDALWSFLAGGGDAVTEAPSWRWNKAELYDPRPGVPGKIYTMEAGWLEEVEWFDAFFFGVIPREAESIDPQQRLLLETCWTALEEAGEHVDRLAAARVGMFLGITSMDYGIQTIQSGRPELLNGTYTTGVSLNGGAGRVAYTLGFTGPCMSIDTACSSSLVALHLAIRSLRAHECSMALSAGVNLTLYPGNSVAMSEARLLSPSGRCRTFDAGADGSVRGEGCGVVVLKRLSDALADGNHIHAVIRGSGVTQDGASSSLSTPNGPAQEAVFRAALADAGVEPAQIDYVEAHGSATPIGDPIEVRSLSSVYGAGRASDDPLWIGSIKTNLGHLESAAGVAGLLKVILSLKAKTMAPHLHFKDPNPEVEWDECGVAVCTETRPWTCATRPRRGAVSGFGVSGTNAHVIVEEAPQTEPSGSSRSRHALVLSAPTPTGLETVTGRLVEHLREHPEQPFADVVHTLQTGRAVFAQRRVAVCGGREEAVALLSSLDAARVVTRQLGPGRARPVVFMFPGTGEHYPGMARGLYDEEPLFREAIDRCSELLRDDLGCDLDELLYASEQPRRADPDAAVDFAAMVRGDGGGLLSRPLHAHSVVVAVEYALGRLLMAWGVQPQMMIGYSTGEYVAACLAGVLSLEDTLTVITERAKLIEAQPRGAMLSVMVGCDEAEPYLGDGVWCAAANSPQVCVLSGGTEQIAACAERLLAAGIAARRIDVEHAFHTPAIAAIEANFLEVLRQIELKAPRIPMISNVTGNRLTAELARDPGYWYRHAVSPVRFADGIATVWKRPDRILLEVGPGQGLSSFAQQQGDTGNGQLTVATMPGRHERQDDAAHLQTALGKLWLAGVALDWRGLYQREDRRKVSLPTYPFERQRYWIEAGHAAPVVSASDARDGKEPIEEWFRVPEWQRRGLGYTTSQRVGQGRSGGHWMLLGDGQGLQGVIAEELRGAGERVLCVTTGPEFVTGDDDRIALDPTQAEHYSLLAHHLRSQGFTVRQVVHLWGTEPLRATAAAGRVEEGLERSFYSVLWLLQALGESFLDEGMAMIAVTSGAKCILGDDLTAPERAPLEGLLRVAPQEVKDLRCCGIDLPIGQLDDGQRRLWARMILEEFASDLPNRSVAFRGTTRWVREMVRIPLEAAVPSALPLRRGGVYLVTGGLGGLGRAVAAHLAENWGAKLILLGRSAPPAKDRWDAILERACEDESAYCQVRLLRSLTEQGVEHMVVTADVADADALTAGVASARERFGAIHGVFHCAGSPGAGLILTKRREACEAVFASKIWGTLNLAEALAGDDLDLIVYFSSIAALQGTLGQSDYAGANAFLDAFAHWQRARGIHAISVNWGVWRYCSWQERLTAALPAAQQFLRDLRNRLGIEFEEGMDALCRVLGLGAPQVAVSSIPLEHLLKEHAELDASSFQEPSDQPLCVRPPGLMTEFVAPRMESETVLAEIWGDVLGIEQIGVVDDFFELGGHSLVGTRIMTQVCRRFGVSMSLRALFAAPTIEKLAIAVEEQIVTDLEALVDVGDGDLVGADTVRHGESED